MGKISDLWVRLGLKKNEFDKGMDDAGKKAEGFGGTLGKIKAGALAVWAAIGASVVAFGKKMIETTNAIGDKWNLFTAQAKAGWDTFVQSLSAMNWSDFIGRFREATNAAKELQNALDAEYEISNSIKLQKAAMAQELADLQILMRDVSKPWQIRQEAAQKYLDMVKPIYQQEIRLANKLLDAQQGKWLAGSGLTDNQQTRDDLSKFLVDIGKNDSMMDILMMYSKAQKTIDRGPNKIGSNYAKLNEAYKIRSSLADDLANLQKEYKTDLIALYRAYDNLRGDKDTQPLVDVMLRVGQATAAFAEDTRRVHSSLNTATAAIEGASDTLKEVAETVERTDLSLPAMTAVTGQAEVQNPDLISKKWLEQQRQRGLEAVAMQAEWLAIMQEGAMQMEDTIVQSMANGLQAITDMMFGLQDADAGAVLAAFIAPFGDMAKNMGAMIMSYGLSMDAFKKAFENPYVAIAAGAGLMAIGAAISSGAQKIASGSMGGGATSYGGSSYGSSPEIQNYESTLTVEVVGRISGSDIILAGQNQQNKWNR